MNESVKELADRVIAGREEQRLAKEREALEKTALFMERSKQLLDYLREMKIPRLQLYAKNITPGNRDYQEPSKDSYDQTASGWILCPPEGGYGGKFLVDADVDDDGTVRIDGFRYSATNLPCSTGHAEHSEYLFTDDSTLSTVLSRLI